MAGPAGTGAIDGGGTRTRVTAVAAADGRAGFGAGRAGVGACVRVRVAVTGMMRYPWFKETADVRRNGHTAPALRYSRCTAASSCADVIMPPSLRPSSDA